MNKQGFINQKNHSRPMSGNQKLTKVTSNMSKNKMNVDIVFYRLYKELNEDELTVLSSFQSSLNHTFLHSFINDL